MLLIVRAASVTFRAMWNQTMNKPVTHHNGARVYLAYALSLDFITKQAENIFEKKK